MNPVKIFRNKLEVLDGSWGGAILRTTSHPDKNDSYLRLSLALGQQDSDVFIPLEAVDWLQAQLNEFKVQALEKQNMKEDQDQTYMAY